MANHASAKKVTRQIIKRAAINKNRSSRIKTFIKRVLSAIELGSKEDADKALVVAQSEIMKGVSHGVLKLNTASRKVSRLVHKVRRMNS